MLSGILSAKFSMKFFAHCVSSMLKATGRKMKGLSDKVLYKIACNKLSVYHKNRCDSGTARNSNLVTAKEKVEALSAKLYMEYGRISEAVI